VDEIEDLVTVHGVKEIDIYDDVWNLDLSRAEKILDLIIRRRLNVHIRCSNGIRVDQVSKKFLKKFIKAGGRYVAFGIESGVQDILDKIPKNISIEQIKKAVNISKKLKLEVTGFFILGLIGDTPETMKKTIDFAINLDLDTAVFNILSPYPGTKLYDIINTDGMILVTNYDDFHHTANHGIFIHPKCPSPLEVETAYKQAYEEFYLRPRYIVKRLFRTRSWSQLHQYIQGGIATLKIIYRKN